MASVGGVPHRGGVYSIAYIQDEKDTKSSNPTWYSHLDEQSVREKYWNVKEGNLVLDIGAAYGSYTLTALAQGAKKVYAWSPECGGSYKAPEKVFLETSLGLNNWQDKGVVYGTGFFDQDGWLDTLNQTFYSEKPPIEEVKNPLFFIQVSKMDTWYNDVFLKADNVKNYNDVYIKIDIEGAECNLLKGGQQAFSELRGNILIENHLFVRPTIADEVKEMLAKLGYEHCDTTPYHTVSHSLYKYKG